MRESRFAAGNIEAFWLQSVRSLVTLMLMPVTGGSRTERDENYRQIERLVGSGVLHGSESLCKLLRFLAEHAIEQPGVLVKEYQIATEVFGRPSYFDPRLDPTVRVQTGRLRSKLAEYYASAGADDAVVVEVPKGSYALTFHQRGRVKVAAAGTDSAGLASPSANLRPVEIPRERPSALPFVAGALSFALLGSIGAVWYLLWTRPAAAVQASVRQEDIAPIRAFWKGFVDEPAFPWVVFSNAEFTGRPETGMRYFDPARDPRDSILDHYTGVGEVLGIHELDHAFELLRHGLRVKRGRLLSLDDVKNNDVIFVGSPSENLSLREVPTSRDFVFRRTEGAGRKGDLAIFNLHPVGREPLMYLASAKVPLTEDFALIALTPGLNPAKLVLLLAGTTTIGTQAAVEYVCRPNTVGELLRRLTGSRSGTVVPFEAVLRVKVSRGVPVASSIEAIHPR